MRFVLRLVTATVLLALAGFLAAAGSLCHVGAEEADSGAEKPKSEGPPPLVIDRSNLLRLEDPPEKTPGTPEVPLADNSACYVCHENYNGEELVMQHAREEIDCIECHGDSFAHRDDEDNITPPDIMYWPEAIAEKCAECHDTHDVSARDVLARWQQRCPQKTEFEKIVCTDCHGFHRLENRTTLWNKKTRKLINRKTTPAETNDAGQAP